MSVTAPNVPIDPDDERQPPPFSPALLEEVFRQFDKTVKARQLYLSNNPSYLTALEKLRAAFAPLWAETDAVTLEVMDTHFKWAGVAIHEHEAKASDSLPWLFYKDGLREVTITRGFEDGELDKLIDIIPKVRRAQADEDDLITLLWEQEFVHLNYRHIDLGQEGAAPLQTGGNPGIAPVRTGGLPTDPASTAAAVRADAAAPETASDRPGIVRLDDFDSTLYFLDPKEIEYIRQEVEAEYASDLRHVVVDALLDIFELQADASVRGEVLQLLDQMVLNLLSAGRFDIVAYLLREIPTVMERARDLDVTHGEHLKALPKRLSEPATLAQILQQLDESPQLPPQADLNALFGELQGAALETIFEWLLQLRNPALRAMLEGAAERLASSNTADLVRLISEAKGAAAVEAVRRAGALKAIAAVTPLGKALSDPRPELRRAAVTALVEIGSAGAMQALERALSDQDREVRMAAVRALGSRGQRSALPRIDAIVKSKEIRAADLTERMAFFNAFGELCGDGGVTFLDGILNGKSGLLGRREDPEYRACAAIALGRVKSPRAEQALQKALAEKDPVVRSAVNRALRGGAP